MPVRLEITAKPGARTPAIAIRAEIVTIAVRERAVDGAANRAVTQAVAAWLGVAPSRVAVALGATTRRKTLAIDGIDAAALARRIAELRTSIKNPA